MKTQTNLNVLSKVIVDSSLGKVETGTYVSIDKLGEPKTNKNESVSVNTYLVVKDFHNDFIPFLDELIQHRVIVSYSVIDEVLNIVDIDETFLKVLEVLEEHDMNENVVKMNLVGNEKLIACINMALEFPKYKSIQELTFELEPMLILKGNNDYYKYTRNNKQKEEK